MSATPTPPKAECRTCLHWFQPLNRQGMGIGQCRCGPPTASFTWPRTREEDTCSSHKFDAGAAAPSPLAGATAGGHDTGNSSPSKAEVGATTGPAFARGKGPARPRH